MKRLRDEISIRRIIMDGGILSLVLGAIVLASLRYNAEIWHDDYPPDVQAKAGPMSARARRERVVVAVPLLAVFFGTPALSNLRLRRANGGRLSFPAAFANAYAVATVFNLFDLLVLDYLVLVWRQPKFAVLPGTEGMPSYNDLRFPFIGFLKGLGYALVLSLATAYLTTRGQTADGAAPVQS